jgi:hypothetical protein
MAQNPEQVVIGISAQDLTGPGFASATAKGQAFQTAMQGAGYSMREARGAAMLLNEEVGAKMSRHLGNVLASSQLIGPALTAMFPLVAAIGFAEIAARIPEAITRMSDAFMGFDAAAKGALENAVASNDKILKSFKDVATGYKYLEQMHQQMAETESKSVFPTGPSSYWKGLLGPAGAAWDYATKLQDNVIERRKTLEKLQERQLAAIQREGELTTENAKKAEEAQKKALAAAQEQLRIFREIMAAVDKLPAVGWSLASRAREFQQWAPITAPTSPGWMPTLPEVNPATPLYSGTAQAMELYRIQTDQNAAIQAAQAIMEKTRTAAEAYSDTIAVLTELLNQGRINQEQFSRAAMDAGKALEKNNQVWKEFGKQTQQSIEYALLFGRSWSDALKAIAADLIKVVVEMYALRAASAFLKVAFGDKEGDSGDSWGSAFSAGVFKGNFASGGYLAPGVWGWAGERGPEPIFGGSTGLSVIPHGAVTHNHYYDLRGADAGAEQRLLRLLPIVEQRAVRRAVATVEERQLRR